MIFRPELVEKILAGEKTETRRRVKEGQPCRYKAGQIYSVQPGRGKAGVARIRVGSVRREQLGAIRREDAIREGFWSVSDFLSYWQSLYGSVDLTMEVWVIRFEVER